MDNKTLTKRTILRLCALLGASLFAHAAMAECQFQGRTYPNCAPPEVGEWQYWTGQAQFNTEEQAIQSYIAIPRNSCLKIIDNPPFGDDYRSQSMMGIEYTNSKVIQVIAVTCDTQQGLGFGSYFPVFKNRTIRCPTGFTPLIDYFDPKKNGICYNNNHYDITLVLPSREIEPDQVLSAAAKVTDASHQPVAGAKIHLRVEAVHGSGGHEHGDDSDVLRRGKLSGIGPEIVATIPTGADGTFPFTFNAPAVSGTYKFTAWCDDRVCTQQGGNTVDVKVEGLMPLPSSENFIVEIGQTNRHPYNHYLTPEAIDKALTLAYYYKDPFSKARLLRYNDASLPWGGVLDLDGDWQPPHSEHRRGTVIDVRANRTPTAIPPANYNKFATLIRKKIGGDFLHEAIGTSNEHFHVRLMGRRE